MSVTISAAPPLALLAASTAGYLAGTIPCADLACRVATGGVTDLRAVGSGNPGAVNAMALLGRGWGYGILLADAAKAVLACAVGRRLAGGPGAHAAGTAAVVGHCFPLWSRFRGGKGVAASMGQCLATFPAYFPIDLAVAWSVGHWRRQAVGAAAYAGTAAASATWVAAGLLWWWRRWPNAWGPAPTVALPLANAASSVVILSRFAAARRARRRQPPA